MVSSVGRCRELSSAWASLVISLVLLSLWYLCGSLVWWLPGSWTLPWQLRAPAGDQGGAVSPFLSFSLVLYTFKRISKAGHCSRLPRYTVGVSEICERLKKSFIHKKIHSDFWCAILGVLTHAEALTATTGYRSAPAT